MAAKPKPKPAAEEAKPRNVINVFHDPSGTVTFDDAIARTITKPNVRAAATIQRFNDNHEVNALARELRVQVEAVNGGDLTRVEGMLFSQAHTLDEMFNNLARRAQRNMTEYLDAAETFMRLALKAQSQCRATLETLAAIKNPPVIYARQANVTTGPQQVNNGVPDSGSNTRAHAPAQEIENQQSKLSGGSHELPSDAGTPALAGGVNQALEAVGAVNRAEVEGG